MPSKSRKWSIKIKHSWIDICMGKTYPCEKMKYENKSHYSSALIDKHLQHFDNRETDFKPPLRKSITPNKIIFFISRLVLLRIVRMYLVTVF